MTLDAHAGLAKPHTLTPAGGNQKKMNSLDQKQPLLTYDGKLGELYGYSSKICCCRSSRLAFIDFGRPPNTRRYIWSRMRFKVSDLNTPARAVNCCKGFYWRLQLSLARLSVQAFSARFCAPSRKCVPGFVPIIVRLHRDRGDRGRRVFQRAALSLEPHRLVWDSWRHDRFVLRLWRVCIAVWPAVHRHARTDGAVGVDAPRGAPHQREQFRQPAVSF